jgi:hypothetical protein
MIDESAGGQAESISCAVEQNHNWQTHTQKETDFQIR